MIDLATQYSKSKNWIREQLLAYTPPPLKQDPRPVVVILDVTYFGRSWGVLVAMDAATSSVLYYATIIHTERILDYEVAVDTLESMGYVVQAAVIDGRLGVRDMLLAKGILVQHCQFHALQTITQCLTRRPTLDANKDLRDIARTIRTKDRETLDSILQQWYNKYGTWLNERYRSEETGRLRYSHPKTRRAYNSLVKNMDYLFTCRLHPTAMPNTTNQLDGQFGAWKTRLKAHRGCSKSLKTKMLVSFFSGTTD